MAVQTGRELPSNYKKKEVEKLSPCFKSEKGFVLRYDTASCSPEHLHPHRCHGGEDDTYVSNGGGPHITNGHRRHQQNGRRCSSQIKNTLRSRRISSESHQVLPSDAGAQTFSPPQTGVAESRDTRRKVDLILLAS